MSTVTVCIPAFGTGADIVPTLDSVLGQRHDDLRVEVAIEPVDDDTEAACARYADDERVTVRINDEVLGWAGNIAGLLERVDTPLFTILAHDDRHHPDYLGRLVDAVRQHPDASVAYADMVLTGAMRRHKRMVLEAGDPTTQLWSFFLAGAEAVPWRGVAHRRVLDTATFPTNRFDSYAVECEWAAHLLCSGPAVRVPEPLYLKRTYGPAGTNVSRRWRRELDTEQRTAAVRHHWTRMAAFAARAEPAGRPEIEAACELAMMLRALGMLEAAAVAAFDLGDRLDRIEGLAAGLDPERADRLAARAAVVRARVAEVTDGPDAVVHATRAVEAAPAYLRAHVELAAALTRRGDHDDARRVASRARAAGLPLDEAPLLDRLAQPDATGVR